MHLEIKMEIDRFIRTRILSMKDISNMDLLQEHNGHYLYVLINPEYVDDVPVRDYDLKGLDVGSLDINGNIRDIFEYYNIIYTGIDLEDGDNVDIVVEQDKYPFPPQYFDFIICNCMLEHTEFFWLSFLEMCRVLKDGGYLFVNVPVWPHYHPHPIDCWRFFGDAYRTLQKWAKKHTYILEIEKQYQLPTTVNDHICIYKKLPTSP